MRTLGEAQAVAALEEVGMHVNAVELISRQPAGGKEVYRVEADPGNQVLYVKGYPENVAGNIRPVVENADEVGLPPSRVVEDVEPIMITEEATGRPFSRMLPLLLAPGIWKYRTPYLETAFEQFGRYLGRLHGIADTPETEFQRTYQKKPKYLTLPGIATTLYDESTLSRIETAFEAVKDASCRVGICHSDPSPHNIYYSKGDIQLIDFGFQRKPVVTDRVLAELGIELMVRRLPYGRTAQLESLLTCFNRGYSESSLDIDVDEATFGTIKLGYILQLLERYSSRAKTPRAIVTKWTDRSTLRRMATGILEEVLSSTSSKPETGESKTGTSRE